MPVAFDNIEKTDMITIFVGAAVDQVGREDRSESLTSENYDESLFSKDYAKKITSEGYDEIRTHLVIYFCHPRVLHHHSHLWCHR